jgi:O-antigen ligase
MLRRFPIIVMIFTVLFGGIIYVLHLKGLITGVNEIYARYTAIGLFVVSFLLIAWQKVKHYRFSWDDLYKNDTLIAVSLTLLLVSLFFKIQLGYYLTAVFFAVCFIRFLYTRKFYAPPNFFYFVIAYALLILVGTLIGDRSGWIYLDKTMSFYVIPLAFCFFRLPQKTLFRIAEIFFRTGIIFMVLCLLYWFFNFLHLDAGFMTWIGGKTSYCAVVDAENTLLCQSSYFWVNKWTGYHHPTFVSFVLLFGLIVGFYLYYKKEIAKLDLVFYTFLCLFVILLMQSRFGTLGFLLVISISSLYYLRYKTKYFKIGLLALLLVSIPGIYLAEKKDSRYVTDNIRENTRQVSIRYIQENFWHGAGMRYERSALEKQVEKMKDEFPELLVDSYNYGHSHNQFLGDMVQFGIWGLIALLAMLVAITHYAIKKRSYLLQMLLCIMLLLMLVDQPLFVQSSITRFLTFLFFCMAICESKKLQSIDEKK